MNKIAFLSLASLLLFSSFNPSQESPETWYSFSPLGEVNSCTLYQNKLVFKTPMDSESEKSNSVMSIEKRVDEQYLILKNKRKKPPYALVAVQKDEEVLKMVTVLTGNSVAEVETLFRDGAVPSWIRLQEQHWYSQEKMTALQQAPGLDELKREDLLKAMQWREPLSEQLQQYLEDTQGDRPHMIYRFVENFRNQQLVIMGYNPYKQVVYNLYKQFEGDEQIIKLLDEEIKF